MAPRVNPARRRRGRAASGRFVLRISPELHAELRGAARELGLSLNEYCACRLAEPVTRSPAAGASHPAVERAIALFGGDLLGVAVFGSCARGEEADGSDFDLLVVLDSRITLDRALYRTWDEEPLAWEGRPVEPHFVHLPPQGELSAGVWAEAALDGLVLFERDRALSAQLVRTRHAIAEGQLVRRLSHGQPYWVHEVA